MVRKNTLREIVTHLFVITRNASFGLGGQSNRGEKTTGVVWFQVSCFFEVFSLIAFRFNHACNSFNTPVLRHAAEPRRHSHAAA